METPRRLTPFLMSLVIPVVIAAGLYVSLIQLWEAGTLNQGFTHLLHLPHVDFINTALFAPAAPKQNHVVYLGCLVRQSRALFHCKISFQPFSPFVILRSLSKLRQRGLSSSTYEEPPTVHRILHDITSCPVRPTCAKPFVRLGKKALFSMTMSELYALSLIAHTGFIHAVRSLLGIARDISDRCLLMVSGPVWISLLVYGIHRTYNLSLLSPNRTCILFKTSLTHISIVVVIYVQ